MKEAKMSENKCNHSNIFNKVCGVCLMPVDLNEVESKNKYNWLEFHYFDMKLIRLIKAENSCWADYKLLSDEEKDEAVMSILKIAHYQHSKDKAVMLKLLEIIESQREALGKIKNVAAYAGNPSKEISEYLIKQGGIKSPEIAEEALTKTELMLNELKGG